MSNHTDHWKVAWVAKRSFRSPLNASWRNESSSNWCKYDWTPGKDVMIFFKEPASEKQCYTDFQMSLVSFMVPPVKSYELYCDHEVVITPHKNKSSILPPQFSQRLAELGVVEAGVLVPNRLLAAWAQTIKAFIGRFTWVLRLSILKSSNISLRF